MVKLRVVFAAVLVALAAPGIARAAARPHLYRPDPIFTSVALDYIQPPRTPTGGVAVLRPLSERVIAAAVADQQRLSYRLLDDLGGFIPAPLGELALASGGRNVVGVAHGQAQIPLFQHLAGGSNSFTFTGSGAGLGAPDNGEQPVPGLGMPPTVPPATNTNTVPSANQGFAGNGGGGGGSDKGGTAPGKGATGGRGRSHTGSGSSAPTTTGRTTTVRTTTPATTTPATVSTTLPTATVPTTTTTGGGSGGGGGGGGTCGADGISIQPDPNNPNGCAIKLFDAAPGSAVHEVLTITNTSDAPYRLALKVSGAENQLWHDLELGVWEDGTPTPNPLPPLLFWATQYNDLTTLNPGESIAYRIELFLPEEAGNGDESLTAIIGFSWEGH